MMWQPGADELKQLLYSLFEKRSVLDRLRGQDTRPATLDRIAASGEVRVVPELLALMAADRELAPKVGRTIAALVRGMTPARLSWLDEHARLSFETYYWPDQWHGLSPGAVADLAQAIDFDPTVVGLVASHGNGYVRAATLEVLAQSSGGQEIPFIAFRANDWVEPVAARATELLVRRLRPDNLRAVLDALPFIARVLGQHRRDHAEIERALRSVLLSDGGNEALARATRFDTPSRRVMFELLTTTSSPSRRRIVTVALADPDDVVRARAVQSVATDAGFEQRDAILERRLRNDPVPAIRRLALAVIVEHTPGRIARLFPDVLFDRAARVRALARFVAGAHHLPLVARDLYLQELAGDHPRLIDVVIDGIGETGTRADATVVAPYLGAAVPRIRCAALRALSRLDAALAVSSAIVALGDQTQSVRSAAADILAANANMVNFDVVGSRVRSLQEPRARMRLVRLFKRAPKWDAAVLLLEALKDPDEAIRVFASRLIDRWVADFNRNQTPPTALQLQRIQALLDSVGSRMSGESARLLRFSLKPL
jgi:hypothetical protein